MTESGQRDSSVVLGAGQLGMAVMEALVETQSEVTIVNSTGISREPLPDGVSVIRGDLNDPGSVESVVRGAHVAFMCAMPPYTEWPDKFPPLARSVVEGIGRTEAKLVFADNLYAYGSTHGKPIREDSPYAATGRKGRTRAEVADIMMDAHKAGQVQVTIGRASDFFGPRVTGSALGERVFASALAGKTVDVVGDVSLPHTYTFIRDFASALVTLSGQDQAYGEVWHVPNARTITTQQWLEMVGEQVGEAPKVRSAGNMMVTLLGLFNPAIREMKEMMYEFTEPYIVDDSKFRNAFGGAATEPDAAIEETLEWYRQRRG